MSEPKHPRSPCGDCPYRKDAPRELWDRFEFERLLAADRSREGSVYGCHKHRDLEPEARGLCAGWLLDQKQRGLPSIRLRVHLIQSESASETLREVHDGGHELFESVEAMCEANGVTPPPLPPDPYGLRR